MGAECKHVVNDKDVAWQEERLPSGRSFFRKKLAAAAAARLEAMDSCQRPRRVKIWDGMWSAWGACGAIFA